MNTVKLYYYSKDGDLVKEDSYETCLNDYERIVAECKNKRSANELPGVENPTEYYLIMQVSTMKNCKPILIAPGFHYVKLRGMM